MATRSKQKRKKKGKGRRVIAARSALNFPGALGVPFKLRLNHRPIVRLEDGDVGYCMDPERMDDCLRPAIATAIQVPVEQLPDPRLDERVAAGDDPETISRESWARIEKWLAGRGLRMVVHSTVPDLRRWVAVCEYDDTWGEETAQIVENARRAGLQPGDIPTFTGHCLVMAHGRILFDPAISLSTPVGTRIRDYEASDISYGLSFERKD